MSDFLDDISEWPSKVAIFIVVCFTMLVLFSSPFVVKSLLKIRRHRDSDKHVELHLTLDSDEAFPYFDAKCLDFGPPQYTVMEHIRSAAPFIRQVRRFLTIQTQIENETGAVCVLIDTGRANVRRIDLYFSDETNAVRTRLAYADMATFHD